MANTEDKAYIASIANFIFDDSLTPEQVTDQIADVAASAFLAAVEASKALDKVPRPGARGHKVAFVHPKALGGVLIELVEEAH